MRYFSEKNIDGQVDVNVNGKEVLQRDLNNIKTWAEKLKMEYDVNKCMIMHLGRLNPGNTYTMDGANISVTTEQKD